MHHDKLVISLLFVLQSILMCSSSREIFGRGKTLAKSAVGSWLEKNKMASRLCVLEKTTDQGRQTGICRIRYKSRWGKGVTTNQWKSCPGKFQCVATESQLHTFTTKDSVHHVTSDSICKCMARERKCRLRSHIQVFYGGTRFEKRINVGECVGRCKGLRGCRCRQLTTKTVTVKGPNGHQCVETVQKCGCEKSCYRVTYKEAFVVRTHDLVHNTTRTSTKVIDVGRCVGSCSGGVKGGCLYWLPVLGKKTDRKKRAAVDPFIKTCLINRQSRSPLCVPKETRTVTLETLTGPTNVDVISTCVCS